MWGSGLLACAHIVHYYIVGCSAAKSHRWSLMLPGGMRSSDSWAPKFLWVPRAACSASYACKYGSDNLSSPEHFATIWRRVQGVMNGAGQQHHALVSQYLKQNWVVWSLPSSLNGGTTHCVVQRQAWRRSASHHRRAFQDAIGMPIDPCVHYQLIHVRCPHFFLQPIGTLRIHRLPSEQCFYHLSDDVWFLGVRVTQEPKRAYIHFRALTIFTTRQR